MRKTILIVTLLMISLFAFAGVASAESYQFEHGTGTAEDPYLVATADDLNGVRDYLSAHFKQVANIDLSGYNNWLPIGNNDTKFTGVYNGNHFVIKNLSINRPDEKRIGLFGKTDHAILKNIALLRINVVGSSRVSGLAGVPEFSTITNCSVEGNLTGGSYVGLLSGWSYFSQFNQCCAEGTIIGGMQIGGLFGMPVNDIISDCYAHVWVSGNVQTGGLIGYNSAISVTNCYSCGNVLALEERWAALSGGLIGETNQVHPHSIITSYYDQETSGQSDTGKGEPKTTAEMQTQATYEGWDFDNIWGIDTNKNNGYPYLRDNTLKSITIIPENATAYPGQYIQYYLELKYENGNTESIVADGNMLTINDTDIAILKSIPNFEEDCEEDFVEALKIGSTTITAYYGGCTCSTTLTVKEYDGIQIDLSDPDNDDILDISPSVININKGDTKPIKIKIYGYNVTDEINISSKDTDILMVNDTLKTIIGISPGSTQLNLSHPEVGLLGYVTVNVLDTAPISNTPPAITLIGKSLINITKGEEYEDPGATAWDEEDDDLTKDIDIDNPVDTSKTGFYTITYTVTDSQGATATKTRTVVVWKEQIPNITISEPEDRVLSHDLPGSQNIIIPELDSKTFTPGQAGTLNLNIPNTDPRNLTNGQPGGSKINIPEPLSRNLNHGQAGTLNITIAGKGSKGLNHGTPGEQNITIPEIQQRELKNGQSGAVNIVIKNK